jgi:hypothetical protein
MENLPHFGVDLAPTVGAIAPVRLKRKQLFCKNEVSRTTADILFISWPLDSWCRFWGVFIISIPRKNLIGVIMFLIIFTISGCEKYSSNNYKNIIGTWVSTDLPDTIEFTKYHDFCITVCILRDHCHSSI